MFGVLIVDDWFLLLSFHPRTVLTPPKFQFLISAEGEGGGEDLVCRGRAVWRDREGVEEKRRTGANVEGSGHCG